MATAAENSREMAYSREPTLLTTASTRPFASSRNACRRSSAPGANAKQKVTRIDFARQLRMENASISFKGVNWAFPVNIN